MGGWVGGVASTAPSHPHAPLPLPSPSPAHCLVPVPPPPLPLSVSEPLNVCCSLLGRACPPLCVCSLVRVGGPVPHSSPTHPRWAGQGLAPGAPLALWSLAIRALGHRTPCVHSVTTLPHSLRPYLYREYLTAAMRGCVWVGRGQWGWGGGIGGGEGAIGVGRGRRGNGGGTVRHKVTKETVGSG